MDYVLIPGAGGRAWYWHVIAARLIDRGHLVSAVELPADDDSKGRPDNAQAVLNAVGNSSGVVIVAASLGAFTAALVVEPLKPAAVVLVNPMIPRSGETPGAWWGNTGAIEARHVHASRSGYPAELDPKIYMVHDVPPEVLATATATATAKGEQSPRTFRDPCTFSSWPEVITVVAGRDDPFFPVEFQRQLARERLGVEPVIVPGGHLVALSKPDELTAAILAATDGL